MIASLDHPSLVRIYDVLRTRGGDRWIVMELVDGATLRRGMESGPLELFSDNHFCAPTTIRFVHSRVT